jgi:hypothetical protein
MTAGFKLNSAYTNLVLEGQSKASPDGRWVRDRRDVPGEGRPLASAGHWHPALPCEGLKSQCQQQVGFTSSRAAGLAARSGLRRRHRLAVQPQARPAGMKMDLMRERFRSNGADLRLGLPLETQTLRRFKEVLLDVMREKGFIHAEVTHDSRPTYGNPRDRTLKFTITKGKRSRPIAPAAPLPSPAQRCSR